MRLSFYSGLAVAMIAADAAQATENTSEEVTTANNGGEGKDWSLSQATSLTKLVSDSDMELETTADLDSDDFYTEVDSEVEDYDDLDGALTLTEIGSEV